jgi:hypothetical protein
MPEDVGMAKEEKGFIAHVFFWLAVAFVTVALYVLSTGPILKLFATPSSSPGPAFLAIYVPLVWLSEKSNCFSSFMEWYMKDVWHVWGGG